MKPCSAVSRLSVCALLILTGGCASPSRSATGQYRDAFGRPVAATSFLSIHAPDGSIQFKTPKGWLIYSQPTRSEPLGYIFNHTVPGYDLGPPLLSVVIRKNPEIRSSTSPDEIIETHLRRQLKGEHPDAGWQKIAEAVTSTGRRVPIYLAIGFPSGGRVTTVIPENGFIVQIDLDCAQGGFDRMMSYQSSVEEIVSSYRLLSDSSNHAMEPTASRRSAKLSDD
jgi:hypothetical protein